MRVFSLLLCLSLLACEGSKPATPPQPAGPSAPVRVRLALNWHPEAEHGGYFAAQLRGYYRDAGIEVDILPGGPEAKVEQRVARGDVEFGVVNADRVLFARAQQAPMVAVMAPMQHNPHCIMVHGSAEIRTFPELSKLKMLALSSGPAFVEYLKKKVDLSGVQIVPYSGNVAQFVQEGAPFGQQGYLISEPYSARLLGAEPHVLPISELGFDPYTSVLIASEDTIAKQPELIAKMVEASIRGWRDYLGTPKDTNAVIHGRNREMSLDALDFGAREMKALIGAAGGPIGRMDPDRWSKLVAQLVETGQLKPGVVDPAAAFTTRFLPVDK